MYKRQAVEQVYRTVCKRGIVPGVRHHDNGSSFPVQFRQQVHHFRTCLLYTSVLVAQEEFHSPQTGAGQGTGHFLRHILRLSLIHI